MIKKGRKQKGTKWDNAKQNNKNIKEGSKTYTRETGTMRKQRRKREKGGQGQTETERTMTKGTKYRYEKGKKLFRPHMFRAALPQKVY